MGCPTWSTFQSIGEMENGRASEVVGTLGLLWQGGMSWDCYKISPTPPPDGSRRISTGTPRIRGATSSVPTPTWACHPCNSSHPTTALGSTSLETACTAHNKRSEEHTSELQSQS